MTSPSSTPRTSGLEDDRLSSWYEIHILDTPGAKIRLQSTFNLSIV